MKVWWMNWWSSLVYNGIKEFGRIKEIKRTIVMTSPVKRWRRDSEAIHRRHRNAKEDNETSLCHSLLHLRCIREVTTLVQEPTQFCVTSFSWSSSKSSINKYGSLCRHLPTFLVRFSCDSSVSLTKCWNRSSLRDSLSASFEASSTFHDRQQELEPTHSMHLQRVCISVLSRQTSSGVPLPEKKVLLFFPVFFKFWWLSCLPCFAQLINIVTFTATTASNLVVHNKLSYKKSSLPAILLQCLHQLSMMLSHQLLRQHNIISLTKKIDSLSSTFVEKRMLSTEQMQL